MKKSKLVLLTMLVSSVCYSMEEYDYEPVDAEIFEFDDQSTGEIPANVEDLLSYVKTGIHDQEVQDSIDNLKTVLDQLPPEALLDISHKVTARRHRDKQTVLLEAIVNSLDAINRRQKDENQTVTIANQQLNKKVVRYILGIKVGSLAAAITFVSGLVVTGATVWQASKC